MEVSDIAFYVLDGIVFVMLARMLVVSARVELAAKPGSSWLAAGAFFAIALIGLLKYSGVFRWVQSLAVAGMGVMYLLIKSGLAPQGIVSLGRLIPYQKVRGLQLNETDGSLQFERGGAPAVLYFDPAKVPELHRYLASHAGSSEK